MKIQHFFKLSIKQRHWVEFLTAMTEKEIKARYKNAVLGFLWAILNPLLQMIVIGFVFHFFVPVKVDNYFLFLFTGLLPWNFFSYSINKTTPAIVYERSLIQKAKFPREAIILSIVLSNMFHLLISLGLLITILVGDKLILEHYSFMQLVLYIARFAWFIPLLIWLGVLTGSVSLLLSALNVKFRDISFIVRAVMPLWFYATPIVYTLNLLPKPLHIFFYLNPVTPIIEGFHWVAMKLPVASIGFGLISVVLTIIFCIVGWKFFINESKFFDDWV